MKKLGARVDLVDGGYSEAEKIAIVYAADNSATWVSPYNDIQVICGQSTVASEVLAQIDDHSPRSVIVPGGGGGLLAGVGARLSSRMRVVGVSSIASPYLYHLFHHGSQEGIVESDSLADGLAGAVEPGSITVPLVKEFTHEFILVEEKSIARAIAYAWYAYHEVIEGSAATVLAAVLDGKVPDLPAVLVMSGGNIQPGIHAQICSEWKEKWN
jgi:threonine dehydratase